MSDVSATAVDWMSPDDPRLERGLPERPWGEAALWTVGLALLFFVIYGACNAFTAQRPDVATCFFSWELSIPLVPLLIVPYLSLDLLFLGSMFLCTDRDELRVLGRRVATAILIAGVAYLVFPLRLGYPRPDVDGPLGKLFAFLWRIDRPFNLAPSLHMALRSILWYVYVRHTAGLTRTLVRGWFVLIAVSAVLTWQHHLVDLVAGQLLAMLCVYLYPDVDAPAAWRALPGRQLTPCAKKGTIYAAGTGMFLGGAIALRPWGLVMLWPAFSLGMLTLAYWILGPAVFRKGDGRLPWNSRVWLGPYLLAHTLGSRACRRKAAPYVQLTENVIFGRILNDAEAQELVDQGVSAVLDLTSEYTECRAFRRLNYKNVPVVDLTLPTAAQFYEAVNFILEHSAHTKVYVHCALGYSRSVCVSAAYLLASGAAESGAEAVATLRDVRPQAVLPERLPGRLDELFGRAVEV